MNILGIETSCDETAAGVVVDGMEVLSSVVSSQVELHGPYGGVVPEIACRSHVEVLPEVITGALDESGLDWCDLDALAVTYGPGLSSSLLVGISAAKALSFRLNIPLFGINHVEAHLYSVFLENKICSFKEACPFVALVVSGGHTSLIQVNGVGDYKLLGQTIDDAAGEAFDKGANLLGLGYPGGPAIDKLAHDGDPAFVRFPRGKPRKGKSHTGNLNPDFCFTFSGLKTSLLYYLKDNPLSGDGLQVASVAASYQEAIVDALINRCQKVIRKGGRLVLGGGVSLNSRLREKLKDLAGSSGFELMLPSPRFCADNAAMIAGLAGASVGLSGDAAATMDACPSLRLG
ncbi:MAG: tRNA (adenosine(37)-N6)-threonylcarbamoyltransferase complex transferase subunit TsaD [Kiritimatiellae bacterium]|nr:tRNA (adenosine(37)-N6)-threonylcarbamoyltransferase complex transferase subunit TsaD [Kiritimatiellia bacterium]